MTTARRKIIFPERPRCHCGKKVKNHHWLCDSCYGDKSKKMQIRMDRKTTAPMKLKIIKSKEIRRRSKK